MIRRSFRIGLALGLLVGLAAALAKVFGTRSDPLLGAAPVPDAAWPRLDEPPVARAEQSVVARPAAVEPPAVDAAPVVDPLPPPAAPVRKAPLKAADPPTKKPPKAPKAAKGAKAAPPTDAPATTAKSTAKKATKSAAKKVTAPPVAWVEPTGAVCPTTHPVKGKLASLIFHLPGGLNYERTRPDRCYLDAAAAEADGLRPAKR